MSTRIVARLALTAVLLYPIAGVVVATPAAAEPLTKPCASEGQIADSVALLLQPLDSPTTIDPVGLILQPLNSPTTSCADDRQACLSAHAQTGFNGERYVPPDAVAGCMATYRDCVHNQS